MASKLEPITKPKRTAANAVRLMVSDRFLVVKLNPCHAMSGNRHFDNGSRLIIKLHRSGLAAFDRHGDRITQSRIVKWHADGALIASSSGL